MPPIATILGSIFELVSLLEQHQDLIQLVLTAATTGKLSKDELMKAIDEAITAAYDLKVKKEMGL